MTFEPIDWPDQDDSAEPTADAGPSIVERFKRYLAARKAAGLRHNDPDTTETERLFP